MRVLVAFALVLALPGVALAQRPEYYLHVETPDAGHEAAGERSESALAGELAASGLRRAGPAAGERLDAIVAAAGPGSWRTDALIVRLLDARPEGVRILALGRLEVHALPGGAFRAEIALVLYDVASETFLLDERAGAEAPGAALAESDAASAMAARVRAALAPPAELRNRAFVHVRTRVDDRPTTARGEGSGIELARAAARLGLVEPDAATAARLHEVAVLELGPESLQSGRIFGRLEAQAGPAVRYLVLGVSRIRFEHRDRVAWIYRANLLVRVYDLESGAVVLTTQAESAGAALTPEQAALDADTLAGRKAAEEIRATLGRTGR